MRFTAIDASIVALLAATAIATPTAEETGLSAVGKRSAWTGCARPDGGACPNKEGQYGCSINGKVVVYISPPAHTGI